MLLLLAIALFLPGVAECLRVHLAETLKLKCDALLYRSYYADGRCYFAIFDEVGESNATARCSAILSGTKVALNVSSSVFYQMRADPSKFLLVNSMFKNFMCVYESGYKCDGPQYTLISGKCYLKSPGRTTYLNAIRYCTVRGMEIPGPANDWENRIIRDMMGKAYVWVQKSLVQENGYKWSQEMDYSRWTTCVPEVAGLYLGSDNSPGLCKRNLAGVIVQNGYWSKAGALMNVVCLKNAENDFMPVATSTTTTTTTTPTTTTPVAPKKSSCSTEFYGDAKTEQELQTAASRMFGEKTCYLLTRTSTRYDIRETTTVETQRGCEILCSNEYLNRKSCIGFTFKDAGFASKCNLLSASNLNENCTQPTIIFLKKTAGCLARTNLTAEMIGVDPCIDKRVDAALNRGMKAGPICKPIDKNTLYIIRAIDNEGRRVTLDNHNISYFEPTGNMWNYMHGFASTRHYIVAATCALAGGDKCPCAPIDYPSKATDTMKNMHPAVPNKVNPCNDDARLYWDRYAGTTGYFGPQHTSTASVTCKAGMWLVFNEKKYESFGITGLSCQKCPRGSYWCDI